MHHRTSLVVALFALSCDSGTVQQNPDASGEPPLLAGEQKCINAPHSIRFDPADVVVAPGAVRPVKVIVDPDVCARTQVTFKTGNDGVVHAPVPGLLDLRHATYDILVTGGAVGTTTLDATVETFGEADTGHPEGAPETVKASLNVEVRDAAPPTCDQGDETSGAQVDGTTNAAKGQKRLANASVSIPAAAFARSDAWGMAPFKADVRCASALAIPNRAMVTISPAVTFRPSDAKDPNQGQSLRREIDFTLPVNPAAIPGPARLRHLEVLYSGVKARTPRPVAVTNPRIERAGGEWVLKFRAPYFGTYQAAFDPQAGSRWRSRHLTHRALLGVSMGGGGVATLGLQHHDKFDAVVSMGGTSDWTWFLWYLENYALGGFCPASNPSCTLPAAGDMPLPEPYAHAMDFNHWWYQKGSGNGGSFPRSEFVQGFTDFALMRGNPNGDNDDPTLSFFARGPKATDPWVKGDTSGLPPVSTLNPQPALDCRLTVDPPKGDSFNPQERQWWDQCIKSRCDPKNALVYPSGYYDDEYNPDGSKQVISFCDDSISGTDRDNASPYGNTWKAPSNGSGFPVGLALAVDLNKNGVRDQNEPVIRQAHEPWEDTGADGLADANEPGYDAVTNPDPSEDDYDAFLNPTGTEGDHVYQPGEPYKDWGLDGVPNTKNTSVVGDVGEGDGKYTISRGMQGFYDADPHAALRRRTSVPGGALDDKAVSRIDILADGGVRDLFNFGNNSRHLIGAMSTRRYADGHPVNATGTLHGFDMLPGQIVGKPDAFQPSLIRWADMPQSPMLWYGDVDAKKDDIELGDGMHVGTAAQILARMELGFYYAAQRWPDADRLLTEATVSNKATTTPDDGSQKFTDIAGKPIAKLDCEIAGRCQIDSFVGKKTGRAGPIAITFPPGYALEENRLRDVRYPVVFVFHGYGQDPRDLEALALITNNFMNDGQRSYASRLPKFIVVYVDGRCRVGKDGSPECYQGTFYLNSTRKDPKSTAPYANGPQMQDWVLEVMDYVDANYRTMGPSDVDVQE